MAALLCGAALFPGLFFSFRRILRNTWTHWSDADVTAVSERLLSAVHASLATAAGVTVVSSCRDVMTDSHWLVNSFVLFGAPYMLFDIYAMYLNHRHTLEGSQTPSRCSLHTVRAFLLRDWMLVLHHLVLVFIFLPITLFFRRGLGDFFIGCLFLTELSTPFICIGKILIQVNNGIGFTRILMWIIPGLHPCFSVSFSQLHLDDTKLYRINGLVALLTFFTCRILLFPFMYWMYGRHASVPLHRVAFHLPLHCNLGNLLLLAPQIYWFGLLLRKAQRLYRRTSKSD